MAGRKNKILKSVIFHLFTLALGFLMVYPLLWLIASSFKSNATMFQNTYSLIPSEWGAIDNYKAAFEGVAGVSFLEFLWNTIVVTVVGTVGGIISSLFAAYAFTRVRFKGANFWFFGGAFFIFLLVQFLRGVPKDLDEAAEIDGCGRLGILFRVLFPVVQPAVVTASIFSFYWIWQDFFQPLIFMSKPQRYTLSLALNMYLDPNSYNNYGGMFAMSVLSLLPILVFFIIFQRYLVDGIAMDGIKG